MTKNRDFKALVRARMAKTGERYTQARQHVLAGRSGQTSAIGGQQPDLAAARNFCVNAGAVGPDGRALSEAMAFGLAGGVGFLYGVFEYAETPTMTIVARLESMPDPFCHPLFERAGVSIDIAETTGAKKAAADLARAVTEAKPALATVGAGGLGYLGLPLDEAAMSPHIVGVVGANDDGSEFLIDDRSPQPLVVGGDEMAAARAGFAKGKHRLVTAAAPARQVDWATVLPEAVQATTVGFDHPPVPQFKSNVGLAGLSKWQHLLTAGNKRGWGTIFVSGRRAAIGLSRLYDCINHAYTAPDAGRPLYAAFLREAADSIGRPAWGEAADLWDVSGSYWRKLSELVAESDPSVARHVELADQLAANIDSGRPDGQEMATLVSTQRELVEQCEMSSTNAAEVCQALAGNVAMIVDTERAALQRMADST